MSPQQEVTQPTAEQVENAKQVYDTILQLWEDQVELASSLRERRKLYLTIIAATGAIGVFRFAWTHRPDEISCFQESQLVEKLAKAIVIFSVILLGLSCVFIFWEGGRVQEEEKEVVLTPAMMAGDESLPTNPTENPPISSGRAIAGIDMDRETQESLVASHPFVVWRSRTISLREAYSDLVEANDVIKGRLRRGLLCLGGSYACLLIVIVLYTLFGK